MKWKIKRILLKVAIAILSLSLLTVAVKTYYNPQPAIKIYQAHDQISAESKYIISQEAIMSKLKSKSEIVSLEQQLDKKDTYVDENWTGIKRQTDLTVHGTYKFGLETKDIHINHIDSNSGIIYIKLPTPKLISLEIPFDKVEFDKTKGFLRLAMDDSEERIFYKAVHKNIETELLNNKELMRTADLYNQQTVKQILFMFPEIKAVIFE